MRWDLSYRNISQYRMITRDAGPAVYNGSRDDHYTWVVREAHGFRLGGWSLGHLNEKARSEEELRNEEKGWDVFLSSLQSAAG